VDVQPRSLAGVRVTTILPKWPSQFVKQLDKLIECSVEVEAKFESAGEAESCQSPGRGGQG
jgi:hypothetical protein